MHNRIDEVGFEHTKYNVIKQFLDNLSIIEEVTEPLSEEKQEHIYTYLFKNDNGNALFKVLEDGIVKVDYEGSILDKKLIKFDKIIYKLAEAHLLDEEWKKRFNKETLILNAGYLEDLWDRSLIFDDDKKQKVTNLLIGNKIDEQPSEIKELRGNYGFTVYSHARIFDVTVFENHVLMYEDNLPIWYEVEDAEKRIREILNN